jgi:DNA-binding XRE family transcriptional regulator
MRRVLLKKPCKVWTGATTSDGYGRIGNLLAHRKAYADAHGPIPDGMLVCHKCDNPPCYEVTHLFLGTHATNHADRNRKGRQARASRHGRTSLSEVQVQQLRKDYQAGARQVDLAATYGIAQQTVSRIVRNETWVGA